MHEAFAAHHLADTRAPLQRKSARLLLYFFPTWIWWTNSCGKIYSQSIIKRRRAPRLDQPRADLLPILNYNGEQQLLVLAGPKDPQDWKDATAAAFCKRKGGDSDASNYSPIALVHTMYKFYATKIQERPNKNCDLRLQRTAAGLLAEKRCLPTHVYSQTPSRLLRSHAHDFSLSVFRLETSFGQT